MKCLALLLCLPMLALANFEACSDRNVPVSFPDPGTSGYRRYRYQVDENGFCTGADLTCTAGFDQTLRGRSWYITENKASNGITYEPASMQLYNVQCPEGNYLHLFPQNLQTESPPAGSDCLSADFVRVIHPELSGGEEVMCGDEAEIRETELFNGGLGKIFLNGNASIEFCSNLNQDVGIPQGTASGLLISGQVFTGFVIRATCVDPKTVLLPNCVVFGIGNRDPQEAEQWEEFLNLQNEAYEKPETLSIPHKRSVRTTKTSHKKSRKTIPKDKRSVSVQKIEFSAGQTVEYINGRFRFQFNNGSDVFIPGGVFSCARTYSDFLGTRNFFEGPMSVTFSGPGVLELYKKSATLEYTIDPTNPTAVSQVLLPSPDIMQRVNLIYEYIFNCWVTAYPVVDISPGSMTYSVPGGDFLDIFLQDSRNRFLEMFGDNAVVPFDQAKASRHLGFLQEVFNGDEGSCYRGALLRAAPSVKDTVPGRLTAFCRLLNRSCDVLLQIACMEILRLDPNGKQG